MCVRCLTFLMKFCVNQCPVSPPHTPQEKQQKETVQEIGSQQEVPGISYGSLPRSGLHLCHGEQIRALQSTNVPGSRDLHCFALFPLESE